MAFLQLPDVRKSYETPKGRYLMLQGLDLVVEEGEFVAIVPGFGPPGHAPTLYRSALSDVGWPRASSPRSMPTLWKETWSG
jgi:hypothetical protein